MPIIGVLCIIGSYSLGLNIFNLYLMLPVGIIGYFLTDMGYPIAPLVIGVILGPMADENLRRALMVSQGSFMPIFPAAGFSDSLYHYRLDYLQPVQAGIRKGPGKLKGQIFSHPGKRINLS